MKIINNISPLPFYESIDMQHHRRDYSFGQIYPLMVPANLIIPFQFIIQPSVTSVFNNDYNNDFDKEGPDTRATQSTTLQHVKLWSLISNTYVDITASMVSNRLQIVGEFEELSYDKTLYNLGMGAGSQQWTSYSNQKHVVLELDKNQYTKIKISTKPDTTCSYAFLKTYTTPTAGTSPDFATGSSVVALTNSEVVLEIPEDANYLVMGVYSEPAAGDPYIMDYPYLYANKNYADKNSDFLLIKYPGTLPVSGLTQEGPYYLEIKLQDIDPIYSDVFVSTKDTTRCILLDYSNSYNLELPQGYIDFSDDFRFRCYLDAAIGKPEYVFEEEVTERTGYSFMESQVSKKRYKFVCIAPEYLCDALRIIRLCNSKRIFDRYSSYELFSFSMEPKWEDQGDLASVECEFETDTVIQNIGNLK